MIDHLKALAVFATTVERGSFRQAARTLGLSPSVVSHHVAALERRLGVALLYRTTRRLTLTTDGERLFESAREMVGAAERGLDAVSSAGSSPAGTLRLTAPALLIHTQFTRDLAAFIAAHPRVKVAADFSERRRDIVRDAIDIALRFGQLDDSSLKAKKLASMQRVLIASPRYVAQKATPRTLSDLESWDFIQLGVLKPRLDLIPPKGKSSRTIAFAPRMIIDSVNAMHQLVVAGAGVASIPEVVARKDLQRGRLVEVLPRWRLTSPDVFAVWPESARRPRLTALFLAYMEPRLRELFAPPA